MVKGLGVVSPDPVDSRDLVKSTMPQNIYLPSEVSLRGYMGTEYAQGSTNACTGYACAEAAEVIVNRLPAHKAIGRVRFSPLWSYWWNRQEGGLGADDRGAYVRDSVKAMAKVGMVALDEMPESVGVHAAPPTRLVDGGVSTFKLDTYERLYADAGTPWQIQRILAVERLPILIGAYVFSQNMQEGVYEWGYPRDHWLPIGSHAMVVMAYRSNRKGGVYFGVTHHWGEKYGRDGLVWIPAAYFTDPRLVHDLWTFNPKLW